MSNSVKILSPKRLVFKETDTSEIFEFQLLQGKQPQDLTDAIVKVVIANDNAVLMNEEIAVISPTDGQISFKLNDEDILSTGLLDVEFEVFYANGEHEIFPDDKYLHINVIPKLSTRPDKYTKVYQYEIVMRHVNELIKDIENELENIVGGDIDSIYATKNEVDSKLAVKADKEHTHEQYLTEHQDISQLATKEELTNELASKADIEHNHDYAYASKTHIHEQYLTEHQDISQLATKEELQNGLNGKADIDHEHEEIPQIIAELANKANSSELDDIEEALEEIVGNTTNSAYATKVELAEKVDSLYAEETYATKDELESALADITSFNVEVANSLEDILDPQEQTFYFVPMEGGEYPDIYDEYVLINGSFEKIGNTKVNLGDYYTKTEVDSKLGDIESLLDAILGGE